MIPQTRGGWSNDGRKVKGTSHWVSVAHAVKAEVHLYNHLFIKENPEDTQPDKDFRSNLNTDSLEILSTCMVEPVLKNAKPGTTYQFLRQGYFCTDSVDSSEKHPVFNRTVSLRDSWAKIQRRS